jgi:hypothetical protein
LGFSASHKEQAHMAAQCCNGRLRRGHRSRGFRPCLFRMAVSARARPRFNAGRPLFGTGFQRWSLYGSRSNRALASPAFGGCSFLRDSRGERHSAVQRSPRSHSSASLRSRSAVALSSWARVSLRYRIARALLMGNSNPTQQKEDSSTGKRFGSGQRWRAVPGCPDSF